jgi:small conductance mechanosensitive channel
VREALREADIEIPFPHRQLFLDEAKAFDSLPRLPSSSQDESDAEDTD